MPFSGREWVMHSRTTHFRILFSFEAFKNWIRFVCVRACTQVGIQILLERIASAIRYNRIAINIAWVKCVIIMEASLHTHPRGCAIQFRNESAFHLHATHLAPSSDRIWNFLCDWFSAALVRPSHAWVRCRYTTLHCICSWRLLPKARISTWTSKRKKSWKIKLKIWFDQSKRTQDA